MVETIDWDKKDADEIYDHFDNLKWEDAYLFLFDLLKNFPKVPVSWMDLFADINEQLVDAGMIKEAVEFIDLYRSTFPGAYESEYQYIEMELIPHFFYMNDVESIKKRLEIIKSNPVPGYDTITIDLLFKLIYQGYYELAIEYSQIVWKPLYEAEDLYGNPHVEFSMSLYLNELEKCYLKIKQGKSIDIENFSREMEEYGFEEDIETFQNVFKNLSEPLDVREIKERTGEINRDMMISLNIQFIKYMKETFGIPFMLSDRFWNILQKPELFGQINSDEGFFYIPYPVLSDHIDGRFDKMFHQNDTEIFGKVYGLKYVYHFLLVNDLIDDNFYAKMCENTHFLEFELMVNIRESLWQMMFVFNWPQLYTYDPYLVRLFSDTYRYSFDTQVEESLNNYLGTFVFPERIQFEIDIHNASKKEFESEFDNDYNFPAPLDPVVNDGPKTGRNDPCPCGSGKKYKKCCLGKEDN